jgi:cation transport ATPase
MRQYKLLRTWSVVLTVLGALSLVSTTIGVVWWVASVDGLWKTAAVVVIGAPVALLLATWPVALGQALRALADIGDDMAFETLTTAASTP